MHDILYLTECPELQLLINQVNTLTSGDDYMKANDYMDQESARQLAIYQLAEVCAAMGLSWSANEKKFIIELPDVIVKRITNAPLQRRKTFDISKWGEPGIDETTLVDDFELPENGEILEEGVPPKGDPNAEA